MMEPYGDSARPANASNQPGSGYAPSTTPFKLGEQLGTLDPLHRAR